MRRSGIWGLACTVGVWAFCASAQTSEPGQKLSLDECLAFALKNNSQLRNAERQVNLAGANVLGSWSGILPQINANFSSARYIQGDITLLRDVPVARDPRDTTRFLYRQLEVTQPGFTRSSHNAGVTLSQNLYDGGQWWNRIKQANASEEAARFSYRAAKQNTIATVKQRYLELLKALKLQQVYEEAVKSSEEQLKRTQSMYEVGSVAQVDVYKAQVNLGQNQVNLITQRNAVAVARANLNAVLGLDPNAPIDIQEISEELEPLDLSFEEAVANAEENNPELRGYELQMRSAELGMKVAKGAYLPSLGFSVSYSRFNTVFNRVYGGLDKNYSVNLGVQLSYNLFNGFQTQANVEREGINYNIAKENLLDRRRTLALQVKQAYLNLKAYEEMKAINEANVKAAQEDLRLAQERYRVGAGTLLETLDAEVALTRAKAQWVSTIYDAKIARAQLEAAMGVLER